jgi:hypothetical protein
MSAAKQPFEIITKDDELYEISEAHLNEVQSKIHIGSSCSINDVGGRITSKSLDIKELDEKIKQFQTNQLGYCFSSGETSISLKDDIKNIKELWNSSMRYTKYEDELLQVVYKVYAENSPYRNCGLIISADEDSNRIRHFTIVEVVSNMVQKRSWCGWSTKSVQEYEVKINGRSIEHFK